ncbi:MAG: acetyltransferase [Tildeniella nuda ZEHNDER 1965/U140]|jgi:hypothetical protein|nr:acetyltransferase [Tildeniella nuda ZEHNDER 1965/U140]
MFLQDKRTSALVEILEIVDLINPAKSTISVRVQKGEEEQDPESIAKDALIFPSGENLPLCWVDADYRADAPGK